MDELLLRMLPSSLWRDIYDAALEKLEQGLLYAFPGHVAGDGRVVSLPRDLVDLVNEDYAPLGLLEIIVSLLQKS